MTVGGALRQGSIHRPCRRRRIGHGSACLGRVFLGTREFMTRRWFGPFSLLPSACRLCGPLDRGSVGPPFGLGLIGARGPIKPGYRGALRPSQDRPRRDKNWGMTSKKSDQKHTVEGQRSDTGPAWLPGLHHDILRESGPLLIRHTQLDVPDQERSRFHPIKRNRSCTGLRRIRSMGSRVRLRIPARPHRVHLVSEPHAVPPKSVLWPALNQATC
jgi:hypothetical protein